MCPPARAQQHHVMQPRSKARRCHRRVPRMPLRPNIVAATRHPKLSATSQRLSANGHRLSAIGRSRPRATGPDHAQAHIDRGPNHNEPSSLHGATRPRHLGLPPLHPWSAAERMPPAREFLCRVAHLDDPPRKQQGQLYTQSLAAKCYDRRPAPSPGPQRNLRLTRSLAVAAPSRAALAPIGLAIRRPVPSPVRIPGPTVSWHLHRR